MGMIRIPELFRSGLVAAEGGIADMVPVYAGSANGSLSAWAFVAPSPGEIPVYGARRVKNWMSGAGQDPRSWYSGRTASAYAATVTAGYLAPDLTESAFRVQINPGDINTVSIYSYIDWWVTSPTWGVASGLAQPVMSCRFSAWMRAFNTSSQYVYFWPYGFVHLTDQWRRMSPHAHAGSDVMAVANQAGGGHVRLTAYGTYGPLDMLIWKPQLEMRPPVVYAQAMQPSEWIEPDRDYGFGAPGVAYFDTTQDYVVTGSMEMVPLDGPPKIPDIVGFMPRTGRNNRLGNSVNARSGQLGGIAQDGLLFDTGSLGMNVITCPLGFFPIRAYEAMASGQVYNPRFFISQASMGPTPLHLQLVIKAGSATAITLGMFQASGGWQSKMLVDIRSGQLLAAPNSGGAVWPGSGANRERAWGWVRPLGDGWSLVSYTDSPASGGSTAGLYLEITTPAVTAISGTAALLYYLAYVGQGLGDAPQAWSPPIGTASGGAASLSAAYLHAPPAHQQGSMGALTTYLEFVPPPGWGGIFRPLRLVDNTTPKAVGTVVEFFPNSGSTELTSSISTGPLGNVWVTLPTQSWQPFTVHRVAISQEADIGTQRMRMAVAYLSGGGSLYLRETLSIASLGAIHTCSGFIAVSSPAAPWSCGIRQFRQYGHYMNAEQLARMVQEF